MIIYLTGSSGFLGRNFLRQFQLKHHIVPVDYKNLLTKDYPRSKSSVFLHLGWSGVLGQYKNEKQLQENNINVAKDICRFLDIYSVNSLIGLGSQAEYKRTNGFLTEESSLFPETHYASSKIAVSNIFLSHCKSMGIDFKWLRLFDVYGPGDSKQWFMPYVITSFLESKAPSLSNCYHLWDYLYIDDACAAIQCFCENLSIDPGFYNLCSGEHVRLRTIVMLIQHLTSSTVNPVFSSSEVCLPSIRGSNQKLLDLNSWSPSTDLMSGLLKTIDFFKQSL